MSAAPHPLAVVVMVVVLAGLDLGGTYAAKEMLTRHSWVYAVLGGGVWLLAFALYAWILTYAALTPVTLGCAVAVQIGVVLMDRFHYDAQLPYGWTVVVAVLIIGQAYLLVGPRPV